MSSIISSGAKIGKNVKIGEFCRIHENVVIGEGSIIEDYCTIGYPSPLAEGKPLIIGSGALVRSYSCLYAGSEIGSNLRTGHRVTIREKSIIGENVQIGTLSDIQGHCTIGNYVRLHSNVHIGQLSEIHDFVWIFPYTVLTNDPHPPSDARFMKGAVIEKFAVLATGVIILPGVRVGTDSLVAAHATVNSNVAPGTIVGGTPARVLGESSKIQLSDKSGPAYPWRRHFKRGYPEDVTLNWDTI